MLRHIFLCFYIFIFKVDCRLWPKGVVHYAINAKDYDIHSQDEIVTTLSRLEKEICVKFFFTHSNYTVNADDKILYFSNPSKIKDCPMDSYDFSKSIVDMAIGYKCLNQKEIARIVTDMLKASIHETPIINSYDLVKAFKELEGEPTNSNLVPPADRNFINANYHHECSALTAPGVIPAVRRSDDAAIISDAAISYYKPKIWPFGVVMYDVADELRTIPGLQAGLHYDLQVAMSIISIVSCVVFQDVKNPQFDGNIIEPKNLLYFGKDGEDEPDYGFKPGTQSIKLESFMEGHPGHKAHALNNLMRAIGIPMMSNRFDRDNYVTINWNRVRKGKEHLLEKMPKESWIRDMTYDFESVTHASVNYLCDDSCKLGAQTVHPNQDHLWRRSMQMGRSTALSDTDIQIVNMIYSDECERRNKDIEVPSYSRLKAQMNFNTSDEKNHHSEEQ